MTKLDWGKTKVRRQLEHSRLHEKFMPKLDTAGFRKTMREIQARHAATTTTLPVPTPTPVAAPPVPPVHRVIETKTMMVTPEQAYKWLDGPTHNRPLRHHEVMKIAYDMGNNGWKFN